MASYDRYLQLGSLSGQPQNSPDQEINPMIYVPRREMWAYDQTRLRAVVSATLSYIDPVYRPRLEVVKNLGASLASSLLTRTLYNRYYQEQVEGIPIVDHFNSKVHSYNTQLNLDNPRVFADFGSIALFGAPKGKKGMRFIAAEIVGDGKDTMTKEIAGFMSSVVPEEDGQEAGIDKTDRRPHISLVKTTSQAAAEAALEVFSKNGQIPGMTVCLLGADSEKIPLYRGSRL